MAYSIITKISSRKKAPLKEALNVLILVLAVPVVVIGWMSLLLYETVFFIRNLFTGKNRDESSDYFHEEMPLIDRNNLKVLLIEDEMDKGLSRINEVWGDEVYGGSTYLYRVKTDPVVPGLHDSICGYFIREVDGGALLQQLTSSQSTKTLKTTMIFIDYVDFSVSIAGEIGAFRLINNENGQSIEGFNQKQTIIIDIFPA